MKNFLYKFEYSSGFKKHIGYNQIKAENEKEAILNIVAKFIDISYAEVGELLTDLLGIDWLVDNFWNLMDTKFISKDGVDEFDLLFIKEVNFDLEV